MIGALLLAAALSPAVGGDEVAVEATPPAAATPVPEADATPERVRYEWGGIGVPLVNYNTTDGLGFGAGAEVFTRPAGTDHGYRDRLSLSTFWTTRGTYTSNYVQYERRGERSLLLARVAYRRWTDMIHVGWGGADAALREDDDVSHRNLVAGPSALFGAIFRLPRSPLQLWAQGYVRQSVVRPDEGSILDLEQPFGVAGGVYFDVSAGVAIQETDRWPMPQRGVRFEASGRGGATFSAGRAAPIVGTNVELMGWWPVAGEWLVVGGRVVFDKTWGQRPFWEGEWLGGQQRDENAYEQMLTGYGRSRVRGDGVLATMIEVRPKLGHVPHSFFDMGFYLSAFAESAFLFDRGWAGPHLPSVGVAPEILWQGAIELRPFVSWGWRADRPGARRTPEAEVGISLLGPL